MNEIGSFAWDLIRWALILFIIVPFLLYLYFKAASLGFHMGRKLSDTLQSKKDEKQ